MTMNLVIWGLNLCVELVNNMNVSLSLNLMTIIDQKTEIRTKSLSKILSKKQTDGVGSRRSQNSN